MTIAQILGYYVVCKDNVAIFITQNKNKAIKYIDEQEDKEKYSIHRYAADVPKLKENK